VHGGDVHYVHHAHTSDVHAGNVERLRRCEAIDVIREQIAKLILIHIRGREKDLAGIRRIAIGASALSVLRIARP